MLQRRLQVFSFEHESSFRDAASGGNDLMSDGCTFYRPLFSHGVQNVAGSLVSHTQLITHIQTPGEHCRKVCRVFSVTFLTFVVWISCRLEHLKCIMISKAIPTPCSVIKQEHTELLPLRQLLQGRIHEFLAAWFYKEGRLSVFVLKFSPKHQGQCIFPPQLFVQFMLGCPSYPWQILT